MKPEDIELYRPYPSQGYGYFKVTGIDYSKSKENPTLQIVFYETGYGATISFKQFIYGLAEDYHQKYPADVLKIGYSDGLFKSDNPKAWKLWVDILRRYCDRSHPQFNYYGAAYDLYNIKWIHYGEFLKYYNYREYIGRPIERFDDPELTAQGNTKVVMVSDCVK
jgi:hypothetical protein